MSSFAGAAPPDSAPTNDVRAIEAVFTQYRNALLQGDGAKAADVMSAATIRYYDGILTHVLNTPREELGKLDFVSRFMVVRIRLVFTRPQISAMNGRELFITGVNRGWISKSTVANVEQLVNIKAGSSQASASIPVAPDMPALFFVKEDGQWKLDLPASFDLANAVMKQEIAKAGMTEDQFIIGFLSSMMSKKVDDRIFSPPE